MRVLILGMNYAPESTGIAPYTTEFAEYLAQAGHEVHVITAPPHFPQWKIWDGYQKRPRGPQLANGVWVHRTYAYVPRYPRKVLHRVLYDSIFSMSVLFGAIFIKRCDKVYVVSPPVQLGLTGWLVAKRHRAPLFFHIKDIVSMAVVGAGMVKQTSVVSRLARKVEDLTHRCADLIGVICGAFEQHLRRTGVPERKIVFFPDYIDTTTIRPGPRMGAFRERQMLAEKEFLVMYSGGISQKQGLDTLVEAAAATPQFRVFIIGEGPTKPDLEKKVSAKGLSNVTILPLQPKHKLSEQLSAADVLVLTQKLAITDAVFPSKLLTYMACGRAIVAAAADNSETARFIRQHRVGIVVPPEDPAALAEALKLLASDPERAAELGKNALRTLLSTFEKHAVLARISKMLCSPQLAAETK